MMGLVTNDSAAGGVGTLTQYQLDAFGTLRVGSPYTLADLVSKYGLDPHDWGTAIVGGGTVTNDLTNSALLLTVGATAADAAQLRSNYYRYQAGKGLSILLTVFCADTGKANQTRRWGLFDGVNGVFFQLQGTTLSVAQRSNVSGAVVNTVVAQSAWNGIKYPLLDVTKNNVYEIRFQWLSAGPVLFYVNGQLVHMIENRNLNAAASMRTAVLPVAAEIVNDAGSAASNMHVVCATVRVDGGTPPPQFTFSRTTGAVTVGANASRYMLAIRPVTPFATVENRIAVIPILAELSSETNRCSFQLVVNPTITGAVWQTPAAGSCVEYDTSGAWTAATGEVIATRFGPSQGTGGAVASQDLTALFGSEPGRRQLRLSPFATVQDTLLLFATNEQAGTTDFRATLTWGEVR